MSVLYMYMCAFVYREEKDGTCKYVVNICQEYEVFKHLQELCFFYIKLQYSS